MKDGQINVDKRKALIFNLKLVVSAFLLASTIWVGVAIAETERDVSVENFATNHAYITQRVVFNATLFPEDASSPEGPQHQTITLDVDYRTDGEQTNAFMQELKLIHPRFSSDLDAIPTNEKVVEAYGTGLDDVVLNASAPTMAIHSFRNYTTAVPVASLDTTKYVGYRYSAMALSPEQLASLWCEYNHAILDGVVGANLTLNYGTQGARPRYVMTQIYPEIPVDTDTSDGFINPFNETMTKALRPGAMICGLNLRFQQGWEIFAIIAVLIVAALTIPPIVNSLTGGGGSTCDDCIVTPDRDVFVCFDSALGINQNVSSEAECTNLRGATREQLEDAFNEAYMRGVADGKAIAMQNTEEVLNDYLQGYLDNGTLSQQDIDHILDAINQQNLNDSESLQLPYTVEEGEEEDSGLPGLGSWTLVDILVTGVAVVILVVVVAAIAYIGLWFVRKVRAKKV